jgi:hypothetical protein
MSSIEDFKSLVFIVGAPRCGTTTMWRMLAGHRPVAVPFVKEPHFFSQHDLRGLGDDELRQRVEQEYLGHFFAERSRGQNVGVDGSVSYLYTPEQLAPIVRLWPSARFIIAVRDPLTLLPSLHKRLLFIGDEDLARFEDAWAAVPDRAEGRQIPKRCIEPRWLRYDEAGRFGTYVERLFNAVGRERCMVSVFDDLERDPAGHSRRILEFVGLEPVKVQVQVARESKQVRYPWLQRLLKRPPRALHPYLANIQLRRRLAKAARDEAVATSGTGKLLALRKRLLRWNELDDAKEPIPIHIQHEIRRHLKGEVERLARLINRDLSHWLQPRHELRA